MNSVRQGFWKLSYWDRQTPPILHTTPLRGWSVTYTLLEINNVVISWSSVLSRWCKLSPNYNIPSAESPPCWSFHFLNSSSIPHFELLPRLYPPLTFRPTLFPCRERFDTHVVAPEYNTINAKESRFITRNTVCSKTKQQSIFHLGL